MIDFFIGIYDQYRGENEWQREIRIRVLTVLKTLINKYQYGEFGELTFTEEFQKKYFSFMENVTDNLFKNLLKSVDFNITMKKVWISL